MANDLKIPNCVQTLESWLTPKFFKALSDPNRISILARLAEGNRPQTVSEVAECCPVNISVVSRHLATLKEAGILESDKRGKQVHYSVRIDQVVELLRGLADALEACCPDGRCTISEDAEEGE